MSYLLDTNALSELRKGSKCNVLVRRWAKANARRDHYISVLSIGEIRKGIEILRRKSPAQCLVFENWLESLQVQYSDTILPVSEEVAEVWGRLNAVRDLPVIDGLIAATAMVFRLTIVTRNTSDFPEAVKIINPWNDAGGTPDLP